MKIVTGIVVLAALGYVVSRLLGKDPLEQVSQVDFGDAKDQLKDLARDARDRLPDAASDVADTVKQTAADLADKARNNI